MPVRSRSRLLPGAPCGVLAVVAACAALQVLTATTGRLDIPGHLVLAVPAHAGLAVVLRWRARHVEAERDTWRRMAAGALAMAVLAALGAVLALLPGIGPALGYTLTLWAPVVAFVAFYGALVRWNRYGTLTDPDNVVTSIAALLSWIAVASALFDQLGGPALPAPERTSLLSSAAACSVLAFTALSARYLGNLPGDRRPMLLAGVFVAQEAVVVSALVTGASGAWIPVASTVGCLVTGLVAVSQPAPARAIPTTPAASTIGAFVVVFLGTAALLLAGVGVSSGLTVWSGSLAVLGGSTRLLLNIRDLSLLAETRVEALTDELTGLPNRRAVMRRIDELTRAGSPLVLALLDLDRFKEVNDGLGHAAGDELLRQVTARLAPLVRAGDLLGRLGGDEFAVVACVDAGVSAEDVAEHLCRRLRQQFVAPFRLESLSVHVGVSIGSTWGRPADDRDGTARLLREADAAMYDAKRAGGGWAPYDRSRHASTGTTLTLVAELRAGIDTGQLVLHHQPQVDVRTGRVVGVEALVRWQHPRLGLLGPDRFLSLAEAHGLMGAVTDQVLAQAVRRLAAWRAQGHRPGMSVNLSASNLLDARLPRRVAALLEAHGVPAGSLVLEVTETVLLSDPERSRAVVADLRALGVEISIDDFGTGYCSLAYLRELPVTELKLDRSFTADLLDDPRTEAIVASAVELAHRLGVRVVAEGVEDEVTLAMLAELGCDRTQGYLHGRPVPAEELRLEPLPVG